MTNAERIAELEREVAESRSALAWVMRWHVKDLSIIQPRHTAAINAALAAEPQREQGS